MEVDAFVQGMATSPFNNSLIRSPADSLGKIHERATAHIKAEEVVLRKNGTSHSKQTKYKENNRDHPARSREAPTEKRVNQRYIPYVAKKNESKVKGRKEASARPRFQVSCNELIGIPGVSERLKFPIVKTNRFLGSQKDIWCNFHQAFGHGIERCIALIYQLADLVKEGLLTKYLEVGQEGLHVEATSSDQRHEALVLSELNTIVGGFSGGKSSASKCRRYAQSVMTLDIKELDNHADLSLCFTKTDMEDMFPHADDPVVISIFIIGRKVHIVLFDQGNSADVMFWG